MNLRSIRYETRRAHVKRILETRAAIDERQSSISEDGKSVKIEGIELPFKVILTTHSDIRVAMTTITIGDVSEERYSGFILADINEKEEDILKWSIFIISMDQVRRNVKLYLNDASYHIVNPYVSLQESLFLKPNESTTQDSFIRELRKCI